MGDITNENLYTVLLGIKEDIGGLKSASDLQLEGLKNHGSRIEDLEEEVAKTKGATKVWGVVAAATASLIGGLTAAAAEWFRW